MSHLRTAFQDSELARTVKANLRKQKGDPAKQPAKCSINRVHTLPLDAPVEEQAFHTVCRSTYSANEVVVPLSVGKRLPAE